MQTRYFQIEGGFIDLEAIAAITGLNEGVRTIITTGGAVFPLPNHAAQPIRDAYLRHKGLVDESVDGLRSIR